MARGRVEQNADDFVLDETQPLGATPPVPVLQQHGLRRVARGDQLGLQQFRHGGAKNIFASGMLRGERVDRGGRGQRLEAVEVGRLLRDAADHVLQRRRIERCVGGEHAVEHAAFLAGLLAGVGQVGVGRQAARGGLIVGGAGRDVDDVDQPADRAAVGRDDRGAGHAQGTDRVARRRHRLQAIQRLIEAGREAARQLAALAAQGLAHAVQQRIA
ncbi:hypothetical protein GALL_379410 [mine drainage metagenome]|uniref:Uncharacterized protein n=1 Tax=mine drainage metagenome TaxID=410659 RepID=A0A1J5QK58_9ZZZZ